MFARICPCFLAVFVVIPTTALGQYSGQQRINNLQREVDDLNEQLSRIDSYVSELEDLLQEKSRSDYPAVLTNAEAQESLRQHLYNKFPDYSLRYLGAGKSYGIGGAHALRRAYRRPDKFIRLHFSPDRGSFCFETTLWIDDHTRRVFYKTRRHRSHKTEFSRPGSEASFGHKRSSAVAKRRHGRAGQQQHLF